ncbi:hypothetical protein PHMEG_00030578 [Phytophthora megakarya]|uniref:Uncharacterized protein n=1 Tax=Phytophthora megakarya TaxID=4795 RepID=A0A225V078_9STRA|nr:hypothetical protein PHMEG_00030578 [Phytophthora megakarya]
MRKFKTNGSQTLLLNIVDHIAGDTMLNDAVIHGALQQMCARLTACYAVDPVNVVEDKLIFPDQPWTLFKTIIVPVYMKSLRHWLLQIVQLRVGSEEKQTPDPGGADQNPHITVILYDPLGDINMPFLEQIWEKYTLRLLQAWHKRDSDRDRFALSFRALVKATS